jgi:hypothetical protein
MPGPSIVLHVPKIALSISDVAIALGIKTQEVRYLLEVRLLPPPRVMLRQRFWLHADVEASLTRIGNRGKVKAENPKWRAK